MRDLAIDVVRGHRLHPVGRGFLYLVGIIHWASRAVLAVVLDLGPHAF
jgi:hypothetical protein